MQARDNKTRTTYHAILLFLPIKRHMNGADLTWKTENKSNDGKSVVLNDIVIYTNS